MRDDANHSLRSFVLSFRIISRRSPANVVSKLAAKCSPEIRSFLPYLSLSFLHLYIYFFLSFFFFSKNQTREKIVIKFIVLARVSGTYHTEEQCSNFITAILIPKMFPALHNVSSFASSFIPNSVAMYLCREAV